MGSETITGRDGVGYIFRYRLFHEDRDERLPLRVNDAAADSLTR